MIRGVVKLSETTVKEVIVPRIDVVFLSLDTETNELLNTVAHCGHSRVPVYKDTIDNVVGILYAKDLLRFLIRGEREIELEKLIRTPYFVPESKKIDSLLREFKKRKVHIAIVVDEYGGTSGIVCLEDIIEEIVGDIQDEFDNEAEEIIEIGDNTYICDARINLEDLNSRLSINLPEDDFDTLGGFVFNLFGKIPVKYEKVGYRNMDFIIHDMEGHKISNVKIVIKKDENGNA
ncbi:MAG: HlyC/CorC family transporter [Spirochaetes bacterium]|nr:HlyC/CorC family transporter [Spirochaetota bacterium]